VVNRPALLLASALALAPVSVPALAEPAAEEPTVADARFHDGKRLLRDGQITAACDAFADSQRLDANIATLLSLADCRERNRELAEALALFTAAIDQAAEVADQPSFLRVATRRAARLRRQVSRLALDVRADGAAPGFTLRLDGEPLATAARDRIVLIDPGTHTITASADGAAPWSVSVTAPTGRAGWIVVVVPALEPQHDPTTAVARVTPLPLPTAPRPEPRAPQPPAPQSRLQPGTCYDDCADEPRGPRLRKRTTSDIYVRSATAPPPPWKR
jgi:hypothetical protein